MSQRLKRRRRPLYTLAWPTGQSDVGEAHLWGAANASAMSQGGDQAQCSPVHQVGIPPSRQRQHHVRQVNNLAAERRSHGSEGHVDEPHLSIPDQDLGWLEVAMSEAVVHPVGVPQSARHRAHHR